MSEEDDIDADWVEAGRLAEAHLAQYHKWNYGDFAWEDGRWRSAIQAAEKGDNSDLIREFLVLKMTPWARNALADMFGRYRLIYQPHRPTRPLHNEFRMDFEQAAEFVKLRRKKFEHDGERATNALSEGASKLGVKEETLKQFIDGKHGKKLPRLD